MIQQRLNKVHQNIEDVITEGRHKNTGAEKLYDSLIYYFEVKGKMIRPKLMLTVAKDLNVSLDVVTEYATALEMIHNYSLIHDDLPSMDNDDYRRGRLTLHKKYNESTAVLAGDYLLNEAFNYLLNNEVVLNENTGSSMKAIGYIASKSNGFGMLGGQIMDLDNSVIDSFDSLIKMYEYKTSALFQCSTAIPAIIEELGNIQIEKFEKIGLLFGLIFQILDDIDDYDQDLMVEKVNIFKFMNIDEINNYLSELKQKLYILVEELNLEKTKNFFIKYIGVA